jgi:outer membrane receptor for ferric coprogen and ferric-rhodotorulic acid
MTSPSPYNSVDLEVYKPKTVYARIYKPSEKSPGPKPSSLSPLSYKVDEAFDKTQSTRRNIVISKTAKDSFTDYEIKRKKFIPGIGKYDITKDSFITKGPHKSYR